MPTIINFAQSCKTSLSLTLSLSLSLFLYLYVLFLALPLSFFLCFPNISISVTLKTQVLTVADEGDGEIEQSEPMEIKQIKNRKAKD